MRILRTLLLALFPLLGAAACTAPHGGYTKLRATDNRGELIAEWVARGPIRKTERGYLVTAVERLSGEPFSVLTKYPDGWRTTVTGPHILRWKTGEPLWLYERSESTTVEREFK